MPGNRSCRVAIIDDQPALLESLRFMLELRGYRAAVYRSAAAFLADGTSEASCLILDHHMPQMTGLDLVARLRAEGVYIPVLLVTGRPSASLHARSADLGIEKVLVKPLNPDELLRFIATYGIA